MLTSEEVCGGKRRCRALKSAPATRRTVEPKELVRPKLVHETVKVLKNE